MIIRPALDPASEIEGARLTVRDPITMEPLAEKGEEKPDSEYWLRRMVEGGVEERVGGEWWQDHESRFDREGLSETVSPSPHAATEGTSR